MHIQFASDLHLEFKENLAYVQSIPFEVTGEILILARDTIYLKDRTMPNRSHIPAENEFNVFRGMNDFCQILYDKHRLRIEDFNAEHENCLTFIKQSVLESTAKHIVVVTHHLPTFQAVAKERINDSMNNAYVTELGNFIADSRIDYWIYGHSHNNIDTEIGTTKIISNQLGYLFKGELAEGFSESRFIELQ